MKYFKSKCPECGKEVITYDAKSVVFCSKACESNARWRRGAFGSTQNKHSWTPDKTKK